MTPRLDVPDGPGGAPVQVWNLRPELLSTVTAMIEGPYKRSQLPAREREAARLRIAQLNDCTLCRDFRAGSARAGGATADLYAHVDDPDEGTYTERERLAIEFAERFALDHRSLDDMFFARLREHFTDPEILDLGICVGNWVGFGRLTMVLDLDEACAVRPRAAV
jgi:AhpD family alkylhydroperoxidase